MTSTTRVPAAEITGLYGAVVKRFSKKMFGKVPESLGVMWHNRPVLKFGLGLGQKSAKWHACDEDLKSYAHMAVASLIGCSWCLDLGYFQAHNEGLDVTKAREVPRWRESDVFTPLERDVLEYAEAMSQTPPTVTDELSARLLEQLGAPALVELTAWVALANLYARTNVALGIEAQGFAASCGLPPLAQPSGASVAAHDRRPLRRPPQPAVHGRLRDARLRRRRRGRRAGDLAAVGGPRRRGRAEVRDPRAYLVRIVTRQALNRLRTLARRREEYVGEWLPEPLLTSPDVAEDVELAESVSFAMLTVLETLDPTERAVFVLREVFDVPYDEIAEAVGKTPAAVRQIAHRAREHVAARRPRVQVSRAEQ